MLWQCANGLLQIIEAVPGPVVSVVLSSLLARETANTLLAGALMGFERLHVAMERHDAPNLSGASTRAMVRLAVRFMFPRS